MTTQTSSHRQLLNYLLFIGILTIIFFCMALRLYRNGLASPFIWDDQEQLVNNGYVHSPANIPLFFSGSTYYSVGADKLSGIFYRPLMLSIYSIIYALYGLQPFYFHFTQLTLHVLVSVLVFVLLCHIFFRLETKKVDTTNLATVIAAALSILFLIHPLNTETVIYVAVMQDPLFVLFGLIAWISAIKIKNAFVASLVILLTLLLSLLSKESGVIFIPVIWLWLYLFQKDRIVRYSILSVSSLIIYISMRCGLAHLCTASLGFAPIAELPFGQRIAHIPAITWYYISNFLYPTNLSIGQHWTVLPITWFTIMQTLLYLLLVCFALVLSARKKIYLFSFCFFLIAFLPYLHSIPLEYTVAIRWFYTPMIALFGIFGVLIYRYHSYKKLLIAVFILFFVSFSTTTYLRVPQWADPLTLFTTDLALTQSFDLENNLGVVLFQIGRYGEAKQHFLRSTELAPGWYTNWLNLGIMYEREGKLTEAERCYKKSVENGVYYGSYNNYASILAKLNKKKAALHFLNTVALREFPHNKELIKLRNQLIQ